MTEPLVCPTCKKEFGFFRWRYECSECGKVTCADCRSDANMLHRGLCKQCSDGVDGAIASVAVVVKSRHVGGHKTVKEYERVVGRGWESDQQRSVTDIKYQASKFGANALLSLEFERSTSSEPGTGKGRHYYSVFRASGVPALIEKSEGGRRRPRADVGGELAALAELLERGHLTQEEFAKAKERLLG